MPDFLLEGRNTGEPVGVMEVTRNVDGPVTASQSAWAKYNHLDSPVLTGRWNATVEDNGKIDWRAVHREIESCLVELERAGQTQFDAYRENRALFAAGWLGRTSPLRDAQRKLMSVGVVTARVFPSSGPPGIDIARGSGGTARFATESVAHAVEALAAQPDNCKKLASVPGERHLFVVLTMSDWEPWRALEFALERGIRTLVLPPEVDCLWISGNSVNVVFEAAASAWFQVVDKPENGLVSLPPPN